MTEQEAKAKWCPFVRLPSLAGGNRGATSDHEVAGAQCVGSGCMAWRWLEAPGPQPPDAPERSNEGWCGLGGKP